MRVKYAFRIASGCFFLNFLNMMGLLFVDFVKCV